MKRDEFCKEDNMSDSTFTYWKKPWLKWVVLAAAIGQGLLLYEKIREYQFVVEAGIFSEEELLQYMAQQRFSCLISGVAILGFLGIFLIGSIAKSKRGARLVEALLLIAMAVVIAVCVVAWRETFTQAMLVVCLSFSIFTMGTGLYTLIKHIKR